MIRLDGQDVVVEEPRRASFGAEALDVCRSLEPSPRPFEGRQVRRHLDPKGASAPES